VGRAVLNGSDVIVEQFFRPLVQFAGGSRDVARSAFVQKFPTVRVEAFHRYQFQLEMFLHHLGLFGTLGLHCLQLEQILVDLKLFLKLFYQKLHGSSL